MQDELFESAPARASTPQASLTEHRGDFGRGQAVWQDSGNGSDEVLHFSAANGFPIASYADFLAQFQDRFRVIGLENRGLWGTPAPKRFSWQQHADDLIAFLENQNEPVIGMGHSIGATVTALAAHKRPDLFRALVLIDPATMPGRYLAQLSTLIPDRIKARLGLVRRTRQRRIHWPNPEAFANSLRDKAAYRRFSATALRQYAEAGLVAQNEGHYRLRYDRDWEALNFQNTASPWRALQKLSIPALVLRGEHSYLHPARHFDWHARRFSPQVSHATIMGVGHMAIQEDRDEVLRLVRDWLER